MKKLLYILILSFIAVSCAQQKAAYIDLSKLKDIEQDINPKLSERELEIYLKDKAIDASINEQQENYALAILDYMEILRFEESAPVYFGIAKNYLAMNKLNQAIRYSYMAVKKDSTFIEAYQLLADTYLQSSDLDNSLKIMSELIKVDSGRGTKFRYARLLEFQDKEKAIKIYNELLDEKSEYQVLYRLHFLYGLTGNVEKEYETSAKLFEMKPDAASAEHLLDYYYEAKDYKKVNFVLDKIDKNLYDEDLLDSYTFIATQMYEKIDSLDKDFSKKFLSRIDSRFYFDWRIMFISGILSHEVKENQKRDLYFDKSLSVADTSTRLHFVVSRFYLRNNDTSKAISVLKDKYIQDTLLNDMTKEKFKLNYQYPMMIAVIYMMQDSLKESYSYLQQASEIDSNQADIWSNMAMLWDKRKDNDSSIYYYKKALFLEPNDPLTNNNYAYCLVESNSNYEEAERCVLISLEADSTNSAYLDTYAWILYKMGKYKKAAEYGEKAIIFDPGAEVYLHLAEIYIRLEDLKKARDIIRKGMELFPDDIDLKKKFKEIQQ